MSTFQFDTSGLVPLDSDFIWGDLTAKEQIRVCAAAHRFWLSLDHSVRVAMAHLGHSVAFSDFTPRALEKVMETDLPIRLAINADGHLDLEEPR